MSAGEKVVTAALRELGVSEHPPGSNSGPRVSEYQRPWKMGTGWPWCGAFADWVYAHAGVDDAGICSPSTELICRNADALGGLAPVGLAPPGSLLVACGLHVEILVHDRGDGILDSVAGNVTDSVGRRVRARDDWRIIVPPALAADAAAPPPLFRDSFGFDDLVLKPRLFGGWPSPEKRDAKMRAYKRAHPDSWVRAVKVSALSPYAFWAGAAGTYGKPWEFGGWRTPAVRAFKLREYQRAHARTGVRLWHRRVPVPATAQTSGISGEESLV